MEETLNSLNFIGKCPCPFQGCVPATSSLALTVDTKQTLQVSGAKCLSSWAEIYPLSKSLWE